MLNFDLSTPQSAKQFLCDFFGISKSEYVQELGIKCQFDIVKIWERNTNRIEAVRLDDIRVYGFHVVGALDGCKEIKTSGLMNLQRVLSSDTELNRMLNKYGVYISVDKHLLCYNDKEYELYYTSGIYSTAPESLEKSLNKVAYRLYVDYNINGFIVNDNVKRYGTDIHKRPEFILTLCNLFRDLNALTIEWENISKSYNVNFYAKMNQINCRSTFGCNSEYEELFDEEIDILKQDLVRLAISRARDEYMGEHYIYIKDYADIPADQIISCVEFSV